MLKCDSGNTTSHAPPHPQRTLRTLTGKPEWYNEACAKAEGTGKKGKKNKKTKNGDNIKSNNTPENRFKYNQAQNGYMHVTRIAMSDHRTRVKEKMTTELKEGSKH